MAWTKKGFAYPRLLLCEGPEDCIFFQGLIDARDIPRYCISDTSTPENGAGGNTGFSRALRSAKFNPNFGAVKTIVVVSDNDSTPDASFASVCDQVVSAGYPRPAAPNQPTAGRPAIAVVMVPAAGEPGDLECMCLPAAHSANAQLAGNVKTFGAMIGSDQWSPSRRGKLQLRVSLSARHPDPFISLRKVFRDHPEMVPLAHPSFDPLEDLLRALA